MAHRKGKHSNSISVTPESKEARNPWLALWRAVVFYSMKDLMGRSSANRSQTLKWVKTRDFYYVCDLAQLDPDRVSRMFYELAIEQGARQHYILQRYAPYLLSEARDDWNVPAPSTRPVVKMKRVSADGAEEFEHV